MFDKEVMGFMVELGERLESRKIKLNAIEKATKVLESTIEKMSEQNAQLIKSNKILQSIINGQQAIAHNYILPEQFNRELAELLNGIEENAD